MKNLINIKI